MASEYTLNIQDADGKNTGYIKYAITPDYSRGIALGEAVTITGKVCWNRLAVKSVGYRIYYDVPDGSVDHFESFANVKIAKGVEGSFTLSFKISDEVFSSFSSRAGRSPFAPSSPWSNEFIVSSGSAGTWSDFDTSEDDDRLLLLKYRFNPQVTVFSVRRSTDAGGRANDGRYLLCESLRIASDSQTLPDGITAASVAVRQADSGATLKTVALTAAQISAVLGSGYTETKPTLFAGLALDLGKEYDVILTLSDPYDTATRSLRISRANAVVDFHPNGFAVGQFSNATPSKPLFEVAPTHKTCLYGGVESIGATAALCTASQQAFGLQCGSDSRSVKADAYVDVTISFPKAFAANPFVFTHFKREFSNAEHVGLEGSVCIKATTTQATFRLCNASTAAKDVPFNWFAIGPMSGTSTASLAVEPPKIVAEGICVDEVLARSDYIAMMAGIEIPTDAEGGSDGMQSDTSGTDAPGIEGEPQRSEKFDTVKLYYDAKVWNAQMVNAAVGRWITADETNKIIGNTDDSKGV